jgi:hypothetical protein
LERLIDGIPIPMDDITMTSFSNSGVTPSKTTKPIDSVTKNDQLILGWSKSNVKLGFNGNIFPQVSLSLF